MEQARGHDITVLPLRHVTAMLQHLDHAEKLTRRPPETGDDRTHRQRMVLGGQQLQYVEPLFQRRGAVKPLVVQHFWRIAGQNSLRSDRQRGATAINFYHATRGYIVCIERGNMINARMTII